jgi:ornithine carbamoyltransferase
MIKAKPEAFLQACRGKTLAMVFEKPSLRTRVTFEVGMQQLGGDAVYLAPSDISLGRRESVADVARNLSRWVHGIMIRTFGHEIVTKLAKEAAVPVINGLSDLLHPCQALGDFLTLMEHKGDLRKIRLAYVGDGNNVAHSLAFTTAKVGATLLLGTPRDYSPKPEILAAARQDALETGAQIILVHTAEEAVRGADAVYTDVWASMGQESEAEIRRGIFRPFQVNAAIMRLAKPDAVFLHCLPAHRNEEVTDEVMDSAQSIVYDQAENRLHIQKAILLALLSDRVEKAKKKVAAPGRGKS